MLPNFKCFGISPEAWFSTSMLVDGKSKTPTFGIEFVPLETRLTSNFDITESRVLTLGQKYYGYIIILAGMVAIVMAHGGSAGMVLGAVSVLTICALSLRWPEIGLLSVFPLLYAMDPTPAGIGGSRFPAGS